MDNGRLLEIKADVHDALWSLNYAEMAEIIAALESARADLESETRWAKQYHDEAEQLRAENDTLISRLDSTHSGIAQLRETLEAEYRNTLELRAENARLRDMIDRSNLEEVDGFTADGPSLKKDGRILISKDLVDQERRISDALATAAKHARENARLREALAQYADHGNWSQAPSSYELDSDPHNLYRNENGWETAERALKSTSQNHEPN